MEFTFVLVTGGYQLVGTGGRDPCYGFRVVVAPM